MEPPADIDDVRARIENALAVLGSTPANDVGAVRQTFKLTRQSLEIARAAVDDLEAQLDVVTGPERDAVKENLALQRQLQDALLRAAELEQRLVMAQADRDADRQLQTMEHERLTELEKKSKDFEDLMMKDDDTFSRYFDKAVEEDEKKRGRRPPQR